MRHPLFNALILSLVSLTLGACVAKPIYTLDAQIPLKGTVSNTSIAMVDKRPSKDSESSMGSLLITSSNYGIYTLGDERFVPVPLAALSQRLLRASATWPTRPQAITLTVRRFNTQNNLQAAMRNSAMGATGLTEVGMYLGEAILGKMREQNVDLRKPFVLCTIEAEADMRWSDGRSDTRKINVTKAQNYLESTSQEDIGKIITATVSNALDAAIVALAK